MADGRRFTDQEWERRMEESDRRFYRNINEIRLQWGWPPINHPSLQAENDENDRFVFIKIHFELYSVSCEILNRVFSGFGVLESIEKLSPPIAFHSKIRFQSKESVIQAVDSLNGRNIYDMCCQLELFHVEEFMGELPNSDLTNEKEGFTESITTTVKPAVLDNSETEFVNDSEEDQASINRLDVFGLGEGLSGVQRFQEEIEVSKSPTEETSNDQEITASNRELIDRMRSELNSTAADITDKNQEISGDRISDFPALHQLKREISEEILVQSESARAEGFQQPSKPKNEDNLEDVQIVGNDSEVNPKPCEIVKCDCVLNDQVAELVNLLIEWIEIVIVNSKKMGRTSFLLNSTDCFISAQKMCEKMHRRDKLWAASVDEKLLVSYGMEWIGVSWPYDRGKTKVVKGGNSEIDKKYVCLCTELGCREVSLGVLIFYPGGMYFKLIDNGLKSLPFDIGGVVLIGRCFGFVFYPGGIHVGRNASCCAESDALLNWLMHIRHGCIRRHC